SPPSDGEDHPGSRRQTGARPLRDRSDQAEKRGDLFHLQLRRRTGGRRSFEEPDRLTAKAKLVLNLSGAFREARRLPEGALWSAGDHAAGPFGGGDRTAGPSGRTPSRR